MKKFNTEQYLRNCGFKKNRDGYMYRNFKHPILKKLNIIFDSGILVVWCQDTAETNCGQVAIIRCKFSVKKFEEITNFLNVK